MRNKWYKYGLALLGLSLLLVYGSWDPASHALFPRCPVRHYTGWLCPGCGSQRALHALLHGEWFRAWQLHPLLLLSLPYLLLGAILDQLRRPSAQLLRWRQRLYGRRAIYVVLTVILGYWLLRNLL
jgi:hypothetical protein